MPYVVKKDDRCPKTEPWGVVNPDTGRLHGCHPSKDKARQQQKALYVNVPDAAAAAPDVTVPALVTLPSVDIVAAGTWDLSTGVATFTTEDLADAVEASQCPAVGAPVIKLGHVDPRFDGEPAVGKVANMSLSAEGNKITGDLAGMPGWLGVVAESAYPNRSVEGAWDFRCQIGHTHPFVITGLALLGVSPPGVGVLGGLESVAALYGVAAAGPQGQGHDWHMEPGGRMAGEVQAAGITTEDVRRAYYGSGVAMSMWITEMQMDPPQLIVCDEAQDTVYRVPFTIKGGAVTFSDPVEVEVEYVDVKAMAAARGSGVMVTFASAEESRKVTAKWDGAAMEKNLGDNPAQTALNKLYALPGDSKSSSKLPHHDVAADGTVDGADTEGCAAAIAALNGARGGLAGVSAADKQKAYDHLAAHLRAAGETPPDFTGSAPEPEPAAAPETDAAAHAMFDGAHSHPHSAYGSQGGDMTHDHTHSHAGDNSHNHAHGAAKEGASRVELNSEQQAALRASLGLTDDDELTPDALLARVRNLSEAASTRQASASAKLPDGVVAVDQDVLEELRRQARSGEEALRRIRVSERDQVINGAISAGKFPVSRRQSYERLWDVDPEGTRQVISAMAKGQVPVEDIGLPGAEDELLDEEYRRLFPPAAAQS